MRQFSIIFVLSAVLINAVNAASFDERVKQYILDNPEVIAQAISLHAEQVQKRKVDEVAQVLKDDIVIGNRNAASKLIAYIDYRCGACKRSYSSLEEFVSLHEDVSLIIRPLPILGVDSVTAALMMYDAEKAGIAALFSKALFESNENVNEARLQKLASIYQIKVPGPLDISSHWAIPNLEINYQQSSMLDNQSVPLYILAVNDKYRIFQGLSSADILNKAYSEMR